MNYINNENNKEETKKMYQARSYIKSITLGRIVSTRPLENKHTTEDLASREEDRGVGMAILERARVEIHL